VTAAALAGADVAVEFTQPDAVLQNIEAAAQAGIYDPQPWIHESHLNGKAIVVVCISGDDLDHAHLPKLLRRDEAEAYLADSLGNCHTST